ncbi:MAG: topoisomerase DNA-binding C4 zinc finger domain-containing protein [Candidatus Odinarchaeia archaeon]
MVFSDLGDSGYFETKESTWDCEKCENETLFSEKPSLIAMNCWKLLIYPENKEKSDKIKTWIKENFEKYDLNGKWIPSFKKKAYTVFVFYFKSKRKMWIFREKLSKELINRNILPIDNSYFLPYQRVCNSYERKFGYWRTWVSKYYPELLKTTLEKVKIQLCPICGNRLILRKGRHGEFYGCSKYPVCNFMLPKPIIFEVLEDGYAEYRIYKGALSGEVFLVTLDGSKIRIRRFAIRK